MLGMLHGSGRATYKGWPDGPIAESDHDRATSGPPLDIEPRTDSGVRPSVAPTISPAVAYLISGGSGHHRARIGPTRGRANPGRAGGWLARPGQHRAKEAGR